MVRYQPGCLEGLSESLLVWALLSLLPSHLSATLFLLSLFSFTKTTSEVVWATKMLLLALECTGRSTLYTWKGKSLIASNLPLPYTEAEKSLQKVFSYHGVGGGCPFTAVYYCWISVPLQKLHLHLTRIIAAQEIGRAGGGGVLDRKDSITTSARITWFNSSTQKFHKINEELPPNNFHPQIKLSARQADFLFSVWAANVRLPVTLL